MAESAQQRLAFLAGASALLAASLDYRTTLESVAHLAVSHLADWCAVNVVVEDGSFPTLAVAHADPAKAELARDLQRRYPPDPNAPYGVPNVIRAGQAELVPKITDEMLAAAAVDDEHLAIVRELGLVSYMCVPLVARGRTLGALTFASTASGRRYGPEDLALAEELGHRAAVAVDNARLYQEAQRAIGIRDQFLTVAAHELRTPITTVRGNTELLVRRVEREDVPLDRGWLAERPRRLLGGVERLHALAPRVLDLNQLQAGSFDLSRGRCDLAAIVEGVVERLRPTITPGSGTTIAVERPEAPVVGWWDPVRVEQVVVNLLQNAIKYQPNGGTIRVTLEATASEATLRVRDQGIGIATGDLPRLFTPYVRADTATANQIGGVGMGLYITAQLVRLHEGTISVSSEVAAGSEFVVRLPLGEVKV